jgi:hypothetical protein
MRKIRVVLASVALAVGMVFFGSYIGERAVESLTEKGMHRYES